MLLYTLGAVAASIAIALFNFLLPPTWVEEIGGVKGWIRVVNSSLAYSIIVTSISSLVLSLPGVDLTLEGDVLRNIAVLCYVFVMSVYTDIKCRKVDRKSIYFAILFTLISLYNYYAAGNSEDMIVMSIAVVLAMSSLIFMPGMGASDGRAFVLLYGAVGFLFGPIAFAVCIMLMMFSSVIYGYIDSKGEIFKKQKNKEDVYKIPLVPFILGPGVIYLTTILPIMSAVS